MRFVATLSLLALVAARADVWTKTHAIDGRAKP